MKNKAILIDLDGTLANCNHRLHYIRSEKKNYKTFSSDEEIEKDMLNSWCSSIISHFKNDHKIIILTGRNEYSRRITLEWLVKHDIYIDEMIMRKDGDFRKGEVVKADEIEKLKEKYDLVFAIDDNIKVAQMMRNMGIVCLQCDENNF